VEIVVVVAVEIELRVGGIGAGCDHAEERARWVAKVCRLMRTIDPSPALLS
jgi:hypothetical protein